MAYLNDNARQFRTALLSPQGWAMAAIVLMLFVLASAFGGPDDIATEAAVAAELCSIERQQDRDARYSKAAQEICGPNAAWKDLGSGQIQCFTHKGRPTVIAKVSL